MEVRIDLNVLKIVSMKIEHMLFIAAFHIY